MKTTSTTPANASASSAEGVASDSSASASSAPTIGKNAQIATLSERLPPGRRDSDRVDQRRDAADRARCGRAEQRHRQHDREERAGDADAAHLDGQQVAADGEDEQQNDELDRLPVGQPWRSPPRYTIAAQSTAICAARMSALRLVTTFRSSAGHPSALMRFRGSRRGHSSGMAFFSWRTTIGWVRGRLAPLAVRPFNRLLSSYTLNELGDSVGIVALAVLVYDRTQAVAPDRGVLRGRQVPAGAGRPGADRAVRPGRPAAEPAGALRRRGARVRRARADRPRRLRPVARAGARPDRRRPCDHRALAHARGGGRGPAARRAAERGQRADEHRVRDRPPSAAPRSPVC